MINMLPSLEREFVFVMNGGDYRLISCLSNERT